MELDKRITDVSKIMNCFTTEEAKKYLHTYGYFTDHIEDFAELDKFDMYELAGIEQDFKYPYSYYYGDKFKFFLPCAFVKEETEQKQEKKYRPFTIDEFENFAVAQIRFRSKSKKTIYQVKYNGFIKYEDTKDIYVILGKNEYSLNTLLNEYEVMINNKWQPFGVEVEE